MDESTRTRRQKIRCTGDEITALREEIKRADFTTLLYPAKLDLARRVKNCIKNYGASLTVASELIIMAKSLLEKQLDAGSKFNVATYKNIQRKFQHLDAMKTSIPHLKCRLSKKIPQKRSYPSPTPPKTQHKIGQTVCQTDGQMSHTDQRDGQTDGQTDGQMSQTSQTGHQTVGQTPDWTPFVGTSVDKSWRIKYPTIKPPSSITNLDNTQQMKEADSIIQLLKAILSTGGKDVVTSDLSASLLKRVTQRAPEKGLDLSKFHLKTHTHS